MTATATLSRPARPLATAPRVDLYATIHKALRLFMSDTLLRVGCLDADDAIECAATLDQLDALLGACRSHVDKEERYVHAAIEARRPGASARIAGEHEEHLQSIASLQAQAAAVRALPGAAAAARLYRQLTGFVAENFAHMEVEESQHNAALWASYDDAELQAIHQRILASIEPAEMALILRWMVPALSPQERAGMLGQMQRDLQPEAMRAVLETVRPHLDGRAWAKLAHALNLPAAAPAAAARGAR